MTNEITPLFTTPYHHIIQKEALLNKQLYQKFLNWISGEFDLYLQDELNGLKVFFPDGMFSITSISENKKNVIIEIHIKSKNLNLLKSISAQIMALHQRINIIYCNSEITKHQQDEIN